MSIAPPLFDETKSDGQRRSERNKLVSRLGDSFCNNDENGVMQERDGTHSIACVASRKTRSLRVACARK